MRWGVIAVLAGLAVLLLLLLDGQTFTHGVQGVCLLAGALGVAVWGARDVRLQPGQRRRYAVAAVLIGLVAVVVLAGLPAARRHQARFNDFNEAVQRGRG